MYVSRTGLGCVQITLQQDYGGQAVDGRFALIVRYAGASQGTLSFAAGPAFIPELDGKAGLVLEFAGELPGVFALAAFFAAHMKGIAHENQFHFVFYRKAPQDFDIVATPFTLQRFQTLRGEPELIAESQTDSLPAEVERENTPRNTHDSIVFGDLL
jgi:hypothetical protein